MRGGRWCAWILAVGVVLLPSLDARAGGDSFAQGDEAAMTGGAVVASSSDQGSAWYNPAGLALNHRTKLTLSGSLYGLHSQRVPDGLVFQNQGVVMGSQGVSGSEVLVIAPTVVMATALRPGITAGFGVFVTDSGYQWLSGDFSVDYSDAMYAYHFEGAYDGNTSHQRYHLGPVVGWAVSSKLRLGFQLMGVYESLVNNQVATMQVSGAYTAALSEQIKDSPIHWALEPGVGLQWEILPRLHYGLMLRGPAIMLRETPEQREAVSVAFSTPPDFLYPGDPGSTTAQVIVQPVRPNAGPGLVRPLQITSGLAWYYDHGWIDAEVEYRHALRTHAARVDLASVWNVRAGIFHRINDVLSLGAGVFTDRSDQRLGILQGPVNLYGASMGLQTRTPVRLWSGGEEGLPSGEATVGPRLMYFGTTVALRYAAGVGPVRSMALGFDDSCFDVVPVNFCTFAGPRTRALRQELSIYVGSSLEF